MMADPWPIAEENSNINKEFEDDFVKFKLPDSEEYLKNLENKLARIKNKKLKSKDIVSSLSEAKDVYLSRLVDAASNIELTDDLDQPLPNNLRRRLSSDRQAQTVGELVELLKHDQLEKALESEADESQQKE